MSQCVCVRVCACVITIARAEGKFQRDEGGGCVCARACVYVFVCMYLCVCICVYVCMCVCMHVTGGDKRLVNRSRLDRAHECEEEQPARQRLLAEGFERGFEPHGGHLVVGWCVCVCVRGLLTTHPAY